MPIVYDVIVTSSTIPFSAIQCCEISMFHKRFGCLVSYEKPPKSQELLFNYIFKPCKNYITFL